MVVGVALAVGLQQPANAGEVEEAKAKIAAINDVLKKALLAGDVDTMLKYYADDMLHMPNYEPMVRGKKAYARKQKEAFAAGLKVHSMNSTTLDVWVEGDIVVEAGTYSISLTPPGSPIPVADNGKYVSVWEKQSDGSLKIKIETWCTDLNPWMLMQPAEEHRE